MKTTDPNLPRPVQPRRWGLSLASVTLAAMPTLAQAERPVTLPQGGLLWLASGTEGGEAGEAGITAEAGDDAAYLAEATIVQGHYHAARDLWAKGDKDLARDLASHPEEEGGLKALVEKVAAKGAPDPTAAIAEFRAALAKEDAGAVDSALSAVDAAFAAVAGVEADETRARFDAVVLVLKAAAGEYADATEGGTVGDPMGWHEAQSFIALAQAELQALSSTDLAAKAAPRALEALAATAPAFATPDTVADPALLLGVAAKVELLASAVR